VPYGRPVSVSELGEEAGGCILLHATSILLACLPSASSLVALVVCAFFIFLSSFVCRLETSGIPPR
jgi:hypothetical protein